MPTPSKRGSPRWTRSPPYDDGARPEARGFFRTRTSRTSRDRWILTGGARPLRREGPGAIRRGGFVGTRSATKVDRGAPEARPAQGRVGVDHDPRHATLPLDHTPSSLGWDVRVSGHGPSSLPTLRPGSSRSGVVTTARFAPSRRAAQTMVAVDRSPQASRDTALARSWVAGNMAAGRGPSRGKGVRAA